MKRLCAKGFQCELVAVPLGVSPPCFHTRRRTRTPLPRIIVLVHLGVVMKRTSSETARVTRPGNHCAGGESNSMGSVVGPVSAVSGFHGAGPVRRAFGICRVITVNAPTSSSRARLAPKQ